MDTIPETEDTASNKDGRINKALFLALFLPMVVLVLVVGYSLAKLRADASINEIIEHDGVQLRLVSGFLGAEVLGSLKHLRSISTEAVTRQALDSDDPKLLQSLEFSFLTLAQRNPQYQQVRWIDEAGIERVRVSREQGVPYLVATEDRQNKSDRYYFKVANALLPGELYISRVDLNEEYGKIDMPPKPILRIATPVENSNRKRRGIIIINIEVKYLFEFVRTPVQTGAEAEYFMVNQEGILLNGDVEGFQADDTQEQGLDFIATHPEVWKTVVESDAGSLELADGLWTWKTLSPVDTFKRVTRIFPQHLVAFDQLISSDFSLTLMAHRPSRTMEDIRGTGRMVISLGVIIILSVYGLSLFFYMSGQARARRAEVEAAYARARTASMARMKELEERFHRLVDASSVGQLVVNGDGKIEIANQTAEQMLGYEEGGLDGLLVDSLLPAGMQEEHARKREQFMQAPEARQMGVGRELKAVRKDGSIFPVEVGLNPYSDNGRPLVLATIIDLSHRQK